MNLSPTMLSRLVASALVALPFSTLAADQTVPGAGNARAIQTAAASPRVQEAHEFLVRQARTIKNGSLREATLDLLQNRNFCVTSRVGVDAAKKSTLLDALKSGGFVNPADEASFPGGLIAGVFPPVLDAARNCPHLPMTFDAAPGSGFSSHHGYPGGLPIHEANNLRAEQGRWAQAEDLYGPAWACSTATATTIVRSMTTKATAMATTTRIQTG